MVLGQKHGTNYLPYTYFVTLPDFFQLMETEPEPVEATLVITTFDGTAAWAAAETGTVNNDVIRIIVADSNVIYFENFFFIILISLFVMFF